MNRQRKLATLLTGSAIAITGAAPIIATAADGSETFTHTNPDQSQYNIHVAVSDTNDATVRTWGTHPPASEFPITISNSSGESVNIRLVGGSTMHHSGIFRATWDPASSTCNNADCDSNDRCTPSIGSECEEVEDGCIDNACGGGGGIVGVAVGFTSSQPYDG